MQCDVCNDGKDYKNIKSHQRMKHPELFFTPLPDINEHPLVVELRQQIAEEKVKRPGKSVEEIAKILYDDIVKPLCQEKGILVGGWDNIDQNDYLKVARRIIERRSRDTEIHQSI